MAIQSRLPVLLTRPAAAAQRFAEQISTIWPERLQPVIAPLMAPVFFSPDLPPEPLGQVIFTSETGVEALGRLTQTRGQAICVGPRTAQAAETLGWRAEIVGGDAEGLVRALTQAPRQGLWLHARGREAAGQMAARVRMGGMNVVEAVVYAQNAQPLASHAIACLTDKAPLLVPVFSPRSGRILVEQLAPLQQAGARLAPLHVIAISQAAARAVESLLPQSVVIAPSPDAPGMIQALRQLPALSANPQPHL